MLRKLKIRYTLIFKMLFRCCFDLHRQASRVGQSGENSPPLNVTHVRIPHPARVITGLSSVLSPGKTIATSQRNISQKCWPNIWQLWPNDSNISVQQIATLLGKHVARLRVATCCELKIELMHMPGRSIVARNWPHDYNIMQHPQMLHEKVDHFQI